MHCVPAWYLKIKQKVSRGDLLLVSPQRVNMVIMSQLITHTLSVILNDSISILHGSLALPLSAILNDIISILHGSLTILLSVILNSSIGILHDGLTLSLSVILNGSISMLHGSLTLPLSVTLNGGISILKCSLSIFHRGLAFFLSVVLAHRLVLHHSLSILNINPMTPITSQSQYIKNQSTTPPISNIKPKPDSQQPFLFGFFSLPLSLYIRC